MALRRGYSGSRASSKPLTTLGTTSILQGGKLHARDVLAEVEADIGSHWNLVDLLHVPLVLETDRLGCPRRIP